MGHDHIPPEIDMAVRAFIRRHKHGLRVLFFASIALVLLLAVGAVWAVIWGATYLKDYVAQKGLPAIPAPIEQTLGDAAFTQLKAQTQFVNDRQLLDPLNRLAEPLLSSIPDKSRRFSLFVSDSKDVNAFALPGGYIVLHRGLLERAKTPEEIQGVLAHEVAHVLKRHGVLQLAQNVGTKTAIDALMGNEGGYRDALIRDGATLLTLKFSRDHERAADDLGWDLLHGAQINPQGMVDFFVSLATEAEAVPGAVPGPTSGLLRTHPAPQERIDRLRQKKAGLGSQTFRSFDEEFRGLQDGLSATSSRQR